MQIDEGPTVQAYCAVDALGISSLLDRDVIITSRDPHTGEPIRVVVATGGDASWQPDETVMVLGTSRSREPSAHCSRCPYTNFDTSAAMADAYLHALGLSGRIVSQTQALHLTDFRSASSRDR